MIIRPFRSTVVFRKGLFSFYPGRWKRAFIECCKSSIKHSDGPDIALKDIIAISEIQFQETH